MMPALGGEIRAAGMIIAIDGPAASGKGTLARRLAAHYRLPYLDTGLLYRAVARALSTTAEPSTDDGAATIVARGSNWRSRRRAAARPRDGRRRLASRPSTGPRRASRLQRRFAQPGGAVLDGRDIGTASPGAEVKIFVTASPRCGPAPLISSFAGAANPEFEIILADIRRRDARDLTRSAAPPAPGRGRAPARHHDAERRGRLHGRARIDRAAAPLKCSLVAARSGLRSGPARTGPRRKSSRSYTLCDAANRPALSAAPALASTPSRPPR